MSAPTLPPGIQGVSRFKASRAKPCASPWECSGVAEGGPAAYLGVPDGTVLVCGSCCDRIEAGELNPPAQPAPAEPQPDPLADGPMPADPYLPEQSEPQQAQPEPRTTLSARVIATEDRTCWYRPGECGGVLEGFEAAWVQRTMPPAMVCGPCADAIEGSKPAPVAAVAPITGPGQVVAPIEDDGPAAVPHAPDPTESVDGRDLIDAQPVEPPLDADPLDHHAYPREGAPLQAPAEVAECACKRVSGKAKFALDADRVVHTHCGGTVREKHRHLVPAELIEQATSQEEAQSDDGDDQPADGGPAAGADAGAGEPVRPADGAARGGEGGGEGGHGAGEGDHGRDQGRGGEAGPGGSVGGDPAQPAQPDAVEVRGGGEPAVGHGAAAEGRAGGGAGAVHEDLGELAPRPDGLTLAAFLTQPHDEHDAPPFTLADFLGQPREEDLRWGAPVNLPDSDNYLGEFSIRELLAEVARRPEVQRPVVALMVSGGPDEWRVEVPR